MLQGRPSRPVKYRLMAGRQIRDWIRPREDTAFRVENSAGRLRAAGAVPSLSWYMVVARWGRISHFAFAHTQLYILPSHNCKSSNRW
jgi:hypothetical protein